MKRRSRRTFEVFSLSMLDCICCGFGAIILLFVLNKMGEPAALEQSRRDLAGLLAKLEEELHQIRGETTLLDRSLRGRQEQLSVEGRKLARLQGDLSAIQGRYKASRELSSVQDIIAGRLLAAQQELTEEMKRQDIKLILVEPYFDLQTPNKIARDTGAKVLVMPPSVGGVKEVQDYLQLFDYDINLLITSIKETGAAAR